jgi:hypothetical protein
MMGMARSLGMKPQVMKPAIWVFFIIDACWFANGIFPERGAVRTLCSAAMLRLMLTRGIIAVEGGECFRSLPRSIR